MTDVEQQRYWLACHEAAHAIIAQVLGARPHLVTIEAGINSSGRFEGYYGPGKRWLSIDARVSLAGPAYDHFISKIDLAGCCKDFQDAIESIGGTIETTSRNWPVFTGPVLEAWKEVQILVHEYRVAIRLLADALIIHRTLKRGELRASITAALRGERYEIAA